MSKRPSPLSPEQAAEVGALVLAMREQGLRWKEIERTFGYKRVQLWRYVRRHLMKQKIRLMKHREDCARVEAA